MARALLTKVHLWRWNGVINTSSTRSLTYLLLSNNSTLQHNQIVSRESSSASDKFRFINRSYGSGAKSHTDQSPSVQSPLMQSMENKIKEHLDADSVTVKDAYGDGRHVSIYVISAAFEGQNTVTRQRTVYKAIWEELQDSVHAVHQMVTLTPTEAKTKNQ